MEGLSHSKHPVVLPDHPLRGSSAQYGVPPYIRLVLIPGWVWWSMVLRLILLSPSCGITGVFMELLFDLGDWWQSDNCCQDWKWCYIHIPCQAVVLPPGLGV